MSTETQSSGLFSIFVISIFSLLLIPYTIYSLCCTESTTAVQPWKQGKKKSKVAALINKYATKGILLLLVLWAVWVLLLLWVQVSVKDMKPFDPFEILGLDSSATDQQIKKAYRQLSLKYHPDKNPDPSANKYFAEFITKAYAALTDEASRQNYEKYGHPDGPQAVNVGVALPSFMFAKDKTAAPIMLLALVGCGILLPLVGVSWYMLSSNRFTGPNNVMAETLAIFLHSKYNVKESQSLVRIPETLVCAVEFITLPTPAEHTQPMDDLRKIVLRYHPDLKDKTAFWKRKASVLKVHMLLLAYLEREDAIPAILKQDLSFVLQKSPVLLEEMFKIACFPRPPLGYGWLTPAIAVVEMQQCLSQAMSTSERKPQGKQADAGTVLLQLPHFNADVVKKLKRRKINSIKELQDLTDSERVEALQSVGIDSSGIEEITTFLMTLPTVHARVNFEMEGESEIMEQDFAKAKVRLVLTRANHKSPSFEPPSKGKAVRAFTPHYKHPHDENWYVILADPNTNSLIGHVKVSLAEAEAVGYQRPKLGEEWAALAAAGNATDANKADTSRAAVGRAADTASKFIRHYNKRPVGGSVGSGLDATGTEALDAPAEEAGQLVEIPFMAPHKAGKYDLQIVLMCDAYIGCDRSVPARLRVSPLTRQAQETREAKALSKQKQQESDEESETDGKAAGNDSNDGSEGSDDDDDESDYEYDSDETGELESGSDDDDDEPEAVSKAQPASNLLDSVIEGAAKE